MVISKGSAWRHKKTGQVYVVLGHCRLERAGERAVRYCNFNESEQPEEWVRSLHEFTDGRFERVTEKII